MSLALIHQTSVGHSSTSTVPTKRSALLSWPTVDTVHKCSAATCIEYSATPIFAMTSKSTSHERALFMSLEHFGSFFTMYENSFCNKEVSVDKLTKEIHASRASFWQFEPHTLLCSVANVRSASSSIEALLPLSLSNVSIASNIHSCGCGVSARRCMKRSARSSLRFLKAPIATSNAVRVPVAARRSAKIDL